MSHSETEQQYGDKNIDRNVFLSVQACYRHRTNHSSDTEYQHHIEYIGTHDISDGDISIALNRTDKTDHHLRSGCAHSDNGQANDKITDSQTFGNGRGTIYKPVGSFYYEKETA